MIILQEEQMQRYHRQLILQGFGPSAQRKLLGSKVLVIGAGGLGSPALLYLASAGLGTIGVAEFDLVDLSNLQRQILYRESCIGLSKNSCAVKTLKELNSKTDFIQHPEKIHHKNIAKTIEQYDFIIDATDTTANKLLINDACVLHKKPFSHGGALQFYGQTMTVLPQLSACLRCAFPTLDPKAAISCSEHGIIGAVAGIIGTLQALEAIKFLGGFGECLTNAVQFFEADTLHFHKSKIHKRSDCPVCSPNPSIKDLCEHNSSRGGS